VQGWKPSTYSVSAHQASAYRLEGRHALAPCAKCHPQGPDSLAARLGRARVQLRPARARCLDCHTDPHRGRFEPGGARAKPDGCRTCHTMDAYRPTRVDAATHARLGFPLEGAHRAAPCQDCHTELRPARAAGATASGPARTLLFADAAGTCDGCHRSPHGDQFAGRRSRTRGGPEGDACDACHGLDAFRPASRFDHQEDSAYRLDGAHAKVRCGACHRSSRDPQGRTFVVYKPTSTRCEDCHVRRPQGAS
jgi:hypothetical protein